MKTFAKLIALASAVLCFLPQLHAAAWDLRLEQRDAANVNRSRTVNVTPNTVLGFGPDRLPVALSVTGTGNSVKDTAPTLINPAVTGTLIASGNVSGANLSGNNTGDQNIVLSGVVTGSGTGNIVTSMASTGVTPATYGNATHTPQVVIGADGRVTSATSVAISSGGGNGTGNVTKGATFAANQLLYVTNATTGEITGIPGATYAPGNNTITFNGTIASTALTPGSITGASGNGKVLVGSGSNFVQGDILAGPGVTATPSAGNVTVGSTDARNFIVGNTTITTNSTGNLTFASANGNATITGDNTTKTITVNVTSGGGGGYETGDIKFILDSGAVPSGWSLTGVNGIPAITSPDVDAKALIKMAGIVGTPTFSPPAGAVASGTVITITSPTSGVTVMTTNNTTDPSRSIGTAGSTWTISANQTIESMAYKDGAYLIDSAVASAAYTITAGSPSWIYPPGITSDPSVIVGNSNVTDVDFAALAKVTFPSAGTVTKLGFWTVFTNATSTLKMAVYDSSRNLVGSGVSASITTGTDAWQEITASVTIPSSGTYYIGFSMDGPYTGSLVGKQGTASAGDEYNTYDSGSYGNFPGSLTGLSSSQYPWAVRAELTP